MVFRILITVFVMLICLGCNRQKEIDSVNSTDSLVIKKFQADLDSCKRSYEILNNEFDTYKLSYYHADQIIREGLTGKRELTIGEKSSSGIRLLTTDQSFYDGPVIKPGETFWGVFKVGQPGDERFQARKIKIIKAGEGAPSDFAFEEGDRSALFYFHGLDPVNPDAIEGKDLKSDFIFPGNVISINFPTYGYLIYADGKFKKKSMTDGSVVFSSITDYELKVRVFQEGKFIREYMLEQMQKIGYYDHMHLNDEIETFLVWAGDIDGDGKLDMIAGNGIKSCSTITLFLSSKAQKDRLFGVAASENICGC